MEKEKLTIRLTLDELSEVKRFAHTENLSLSQASRKLITQSLQKTTYQNRTIKLHSQILVELLMIARVSMDNDPAKYEDVISRAEAFIQDNL